MTYTYVHRARIPSEPTDTHRYCMLIPIVYLVLKLHIVWIGQQQYNGNNNKTQQQQQPINAFYRVTEIHVCNCEIPISGKDQSQEVAKST